MSTHGWGLRVTLMAAIVGASAVGACSLGPAVSPLPSSTSAAAGGGVIDAEPTLFVLPPQQWQVGCLGVDADLCRQMAEGAANGWQPTDPALRLVLVRCTVASCSAGDATGETVLVFVDGTSRTVGSWGVSVPAGTPPPPPLRPAGDWELICERIPRPTCEEFAVEAYETVNEIGGQLTTLTVACTAASCTNESGEGETVAVFADGTQQSIAGWEYHGSSPP